MDLSPENDQIAFNDIQGRRASIYVHDFTLGTTRQLNTGGFRNLYPHWSPDGEFITFSSNSLDGVQNIYRIPAAGSSEQPERLAPSADQNQEMMSWSSDGVIAFRQWGDSIENGAIWVLPPDGEPRAFTSSELGVAHATFSPDGEWLAYSARGSRGREVYIRPYPGPGPAVLIAGNNSDAPAWSSDGTQLYFRQFDSSLQRIAMMVVDITEGRPSPARTLIAPWPYYGTNPLRTYEVLEDGRFIAALQDASLNDPVSYRAKELQVVLNFFEVLRQRVTNESRETGPQ